MIDSLRDVQHQLFGSRSSSYRVGREYYDISYLPSRDCRCQERNDRDRPARDIHRSRSRSPPPRGLEKPAEHMDLPTDPLVALHTAPMPPRSLVTSQSQRPSDCRRHGEHTTVHRHNKESSGVEIISEDFSADPNVRMAELRQEFSNLCFEWFYFPPNPKKVLDDVQRMTINCVADIYMQYREWMKPRKKYQKFPSNARQKSKN